MHKLSTIRSYVFGALTACVVSSSPVYAQPAEEPATPPARPVVMPMVPGQTLQNSKDTSAAKKPKAKIVSTGSGEKSPTIGISNEPQKFPNDYAFCNLTSYTLVLAIGLRHQDLITTKGWWNISPGECKMIIKGPLKQPSYFSYARSHAAHTGPIRQWGGTHNLCVGKGPFQASSDESNACGPGHEPQGFSRIDVNGKTSWLTRLAEKDAFKTYEQARIAGLQRLLSDLGTFDGAVDGVAGAKLNQALAQAKSTFAITSSDHAVVYRRLLEEATKVQGVSGLTFCNRTDQIIAAALGLEVQGKTKSMGWWKLQPAQCEKVIKEPLTEPVLYAYASEELSSGEARKWGGGKKLCTKEIVFEFEDTAECGGKGYTSTGFRKIDTNGQPGTTYEFTTDNAGETDAQ